MFHDSGYQIFPTVFLEDECKQIFSTLNKEPAKKSVSWKKSMATVDHNYYAIAKCDRIIEIVSNLIGKDIVLWGARLVWKKPGQLHNWHTDIETYEDGAHKVNVWVALNNVQIMERILRWDLSGESGLLKNDCLL